MQERTPDWQDRAIAYAEACEVWSRAVIEAMLPIAEAFSASLRRALNMMLPPAISYGRARRSYRRDLHRAYRRRYHQRPPLQNRRSET